MDLYEQGIVRPLAGDFQAPRHPRIQFLTRHMEAVVGWSRARVRSEDEDTRKRLRGQVPEALTMCAHPQLMP